MILWSIAIILAVFIFVYFGSCYFSYFYPLRYKQEITVASEKYGIEKAVIASIINAESKFDSQALSRKGAMGLMQIMPTTAEWVSEKYDISYISSEDLYVPAINIEIGTSYFAYLFKKFESFDTALSAYNAGEGTVQKWLANENFSIDKVNLSIIPYTETKNYINKVNKNYKYYSKIF